MRNGIVDMKGIFPDRSDTFLAAGNVSSIKKTYFHLLSAYLPARQIAFGLIAAMAEWLRRLT